MAIKHHTIKRFKPSGADQPTKTYTAGGTIVAGAPCVLSSGLAVEATDDDAGAAGPIIGFAEHTAVVTEDVRVVPCEGPAEFIGSLTDVAASVASDGGTKALAATDVSATPRELHKDDTTLKWVVGATGGANASAVVVGLIDPVGATTNDAVNMSTPNSGKALVRFIIQNADTISA
jgi:hypothetical protein